MNKRFIDAEALTRSIVTDRWQRGLNDREVAEGIAYTLHKITKAPAADVVEVVRCKDCYYWEKDDEKDDVGCCLNPDGLVNYARMDDFCSCGERKEEAKEK